MTGGGECWTKDGRPKRRFDTRAAARRVARRFPDEDTKPYRCQRCGWFHLGHYPTARDVRERLRERHRRAT